MDSTVQVVVASERISILAADVSKDNINIYADLGSEIVEKEVPNKTESIELSLKGFQSKARKAGYGKCMVVCEPTGVCHLPLFRIAARLGYETRQVNTEAVSKMRVIETNDAGKTDIRDPKRHSYSCPHRKNSKIQEFWEELSAFERMESRSGGHILN